MEKRIWTLTGVPKVDRAGLSRQLLEELPKAVRKLLPSAVEASVTLQEPTEYSGALVEVEGSSHTIDAVIEVQSSVACPRSTSSTAISASTGLTRKDGG